MALERHVLLTIVQIGTIGNTGCQVETGVQLGSTLTRGPFRAPYAKDLWIVTSAELVRTASYAS